MADIVASLTYHHKNRHGLGTNRTFSKNEPKRIHAVTAFCSHAGTLVDMQAEHEHSPLNDDEPDQSRFSPVLGENVRRMRSYSNITKTRLALMVSIGRPLLNRIEDGTADVRLSVVTKLADSLATTPSFLLAKHSDEDIRHEIAHRKASSPVAAVRHARFY